MDFAVSVVLSVGWRTVYRPTLVLLVGGRWSSCPGADLALGTSSNRHPLTQDPTLSTCPGKHSHGSTRARVKGGFMSVAFGGQEMEAT